MPRIAFDGRYINDRYHGIGRYAFSMLNAMTALAPEYQFVVYQGAEKNTRFDWEELADRANVTIARGPWPMYLPQEQLFWPFHLKRTGVDLFHSPYFFIPWLTPLPGLITIHDLIFDRFPEYMPVPWARAYYRLLMAIGVKRARRVFTVSQATADDLAAFYPVHPDKIVVTSEGVDAPFRPVSDPDQQEDLRRRYHLARPFILSVGTRRPHKNHQLLVRAFARLSTALPHDLVFAGPPDPRFPDQAELTAKDYPLNGRIRLLNWVPEVDLPGLYSLADIVVLPSLIEGFGLPALEAMACGTPVIASKGSSFPEVIGPAGVLLEPEDPAILASAILDILTDDKLREKFSAAGLERAAIFNWENTARRVLSTYAEILG